MNILVFDDITTGVLEEKSQHKNKEDKLASSQQAETLTVTRGRLPESNPNRSYNQGGSK